ncbi:hypothetical protein LPJ61_006971, partial [Coemansia biformis]
MCTITALGADSGVVIESASDYLRQLQRNMLLPLRKLQPSMLMSAIAVVAKVGNVAKAPGECLQLPLHVVDPTIGRGNPVPVSIFRRSLETMPDIRGPGDILYLEAAMTNVVEGQCHIFNNFGTLWQIHHHSTPVDGRHPILEYLRNWWQETEASDAAEGQLPLQTSQAALGGEASDTDTHVGPVAERDEANVNAALNINNRTLSLVVDTTTATAAVPAAVLAVAPLRPPPPLPTDSPKAPPTAISRFQTPYLKRICDFEPGRFGDVIVEVLHVEPPVDDTEYFGHEMQR